MIVVVVDVDVAAVDVLLFRGWARDRHGGAKNKTTVGRSDSLASRVNPQCKHLPSFLIQLHDDTVTQQ